MELAYLIFWPSVLFVLYVFIKVTNAKERDKLSTYAAILVIAMGIIGFSYQVISSGSLPAPCCSP